jgi:DNA polymerase gamma 1
MGNTKNLTVLGYASLSPEMEKKVFGEKTEKYVPTPMEKNSIIEEMEKFGVEFPIKNPDSFFIPEFNLPDLEADTIQEHFKKISESLVGEKSEVMKDFANSSAPRVPQNILNKKGWVRYAAEEISIVPYPLEDIFIFDCETFVKGSNFGHPILATAVSDKAYYIWMHESYVNPNIEYEPTLVPVGKNKIIIAHNVAFDRARTEEAYLLAEDVNFWFDTMSAHINVSGLASGQRWYFLQKNNKWNLSRPQWSDKGCLNNLIDCYNFHCHPIVPLEPEDKKIRDIFVVSETMEEIVRYKEDLNRYALNDVKITYELYSILFLKYLQSNPSLTTLLGHFAIGSAQLPVVDDWDKWFADCEHQWEKSIARQEEILGEMADELYTDWSAGFIEPEDDPWLSQLDWSMDTKVSKNGKVGKYYMIPAWYKPRIKTGKPMEISTKNRLSHILLRLKWDGKPIKYFTDMGWCYMDDEQGDYVRIPHTQGEGVNVGGVLTKDYVEDFESGMLSSDSEAAKELISLSVNVAYWTSVRSRVLEQFVKKVENPLGSSCNLIVPATVPHNTSTNRAGENLWLTVPDPKYLKIGSEIKTRVQAPDGWVFVQSDFDK